MSGIVQNISWGQIWTFPFHEAIAEWNGIVKIWPNDIFLLSHEFRQLIFVLYHDITCVCFRQQDGKNYPMAQIASNHWNHDIIQNISWGQIWTFPFHEAIAEWNGIVKIWPNDIFLLSHEFRQLIFVLYHDITCVCFRPEDGKNYPMAQIIEIMI